MVSEPEMSNTDGESTSEHKFDIAAAAWRGSHSSPERERSMIE